MRHLLIGYSYTARNGKLFMGRYDNVFDSFPNPIDLKKQILLENPSAKDLLILSISELTRADFLDFIEQ